MSRTQEHNHFFKMLDVEWNTVKAIINRWRKLPRTGRHFRIDERTRRKLIREADIIRATGISDKVFFKIFLDIILKDILDTKTR